MKSRRLTTAAAAAALVAGFAALAPASSYAQDSGNWIVRARALYLDSSNDDSTGLDLSVNNKTFPEIDISYFFSPNLALELILTYPQEHDVRAGGTTIGTLKHLPPTLTLRTTTLAFDNMVCGRNARRVNVFDEVLREAAASGALS